MEMSTNSTTLYMIFKIFLCIKSKICEIFVHFGQVSLKLARILHLFLFKNLTNNKMILLHDLKICAQNMFGREKWSKNSIRASDAMSKLASITTRAVTATNLSSTSRKATGSQCKTAKKPTFAKAS